YELSNYIISKITIHKSKDTAMQNEIWMLIGALLILIRIIATRTSRWFGVPALLLFLGE
ncbi:MAG: hypothetical protein RI985_2232, partial [Chloroflexota bacterium]